MSDALVFDSCFGRSQIHLFLKKTGCVAPRTDFSVKVSTWSNRSGNASPSATQHSLIGNERSGGSSFCLDQNGEGGIRTHGAREDTLVFKTRAINHSTTSPVCLHGHRGFESHPLRFDPTKTKILQIFRSQSKNVVWPTVMHHRSDSTTSIP